MKIADFFTKVDVLTPDETREMLEKQNNASIVLLDVREPSEYEQRHLPGAILLPLSSLLDNINTLNIARTTITYCARGMRSRSAAALLKRQGFKDVYSIRGGIEAWDGLVAQGEYDAGMHLLEGRKSPEELVSLAWGMEEGTRIFYVKAHDILTDSKARNILQSLAQAEEHHKESLMTSLTQMMKTNITDDKIREMAPNGIMESGVSIDDAIIWITNQKELLVSALELCMQLEANSLDLYLKIFHVIENPKPQAVFQQLIQEEKIHLSRLGKLLEENLVH